MSEDKMMRLSQVARKLNVGSSTIVDFLSNKGFDVDSSPNSKINSEQYRMLATEFAGSASDKEEASGLTIGKKHVENQVIKAQTDTPEPPVKEEEEKVLVKGLSSDTEPESDKLEIDSPKLQGIKVVGKIDLNKKGKAETPKVKEAEAPKEETKPVEKKEVVAEAPKEEITKEEPVKEDTVAEVEVPTASEKEVEPAEPVKDEAPAPAETPEKKEPEPIEKVEVVAKTDEPIAAEEKVAAEDEVTTDGSSDSVIEAKADSLKGLTVLGKIELPVERAKKKDNKAGASAEEKKKKRPRKRVVTPANKGSQSPSSGGGVGRPSFDSRRNQGGAHKKSTRGDKREAKKEITDKDIQEQIKATLAKLSGNKGSNVSRSKYRREKRSEVAAAHEEKLLQDIEDAKVLKVTEFISASDLASLLDVSVNDIISKCMMLGMFVSINQRLDAESITVIADEYGYNVEFTSADDEIDVLVEEDNEEDLLDRAPIVTIMGHVDHGKTSLLDYIRSAKVTEGEAGGITQHIGAYDVTTDTGKRIAFLDTPGHEAFTAMRARGAKITDVVVIVVAADDSVMPQTKEAINHAQLAGVPIIIALNKIDKPNANPDKVKEELSAINILVEDWGGKYQCQEISAKTGQGIDDLLEKVLLESELLELKANPNKAAIGTVIEAELDKGRGYVTTMMVQEGTLKVGDIVLAGSHQGRVKAMFDHRGKKLKEAPPATPIQLLGLGGAPQAGDKFNVMGTEREAREIANKREQILREQTLRTKKHITLDEIGRRLAVGSFKELNVIVKGDVDGSVEALSDSLLKLSTEEIQVSILHKAVGPISETDVLLASASDAIIIGFQVRPSPSARKLAESEEIEIRLYSIIYDAINEIKDAMEGMLAPTVEEVITGNIEVREVFKISKIGTVAGCYVTDGYVKRNNKVRLIRDGIVIYTGDINQLKRFKDDVTEVKQSYECGISIKNFNDIKMGDIIEGFEEREIKRTL